MSRLCDLIEEQLGRRDTKIEEELKVKYPVLDILDIEKLSYRDKQTIINEVALYSMSKEQRLIQFFMEKVEAGTQQAVEYTDNFDISALDNTVLHGEKCIIRVTGRMLSGIWYT